MCGKLRSNISKIIGDDGDASVLQHEGNVVDGSNRIGQMLKNLEREHNIILLFQEGFIVGNRMDGTIEEPAPIKAPDRKPGCGAVGEVEVIHLEIMAGEENGVAASAIAKHQYAYVAVRASLPGCQRTHSFQGLFCPTVAAGFSPEDHGFEDETIALLIQLRHFWRIDEGGDTKPSDIL